MTAPPRVSIGLPVYDGAEFLGQALDSLLGQTFGDFELLVSDNASTDATEEICRTYAIKDERIVYHRSPDNLGAAVNFNGVFERSRGEYFKWAACDDLCAPAFLERCVAVLDADPRAVLAYPRTVDIDDDGRVLAHPYWELHGDDPRPDQRFRHQLLSEHWCYHVFGLWRSRALRRTRLIDAYVASDRVLLAHLALLGTFREIDEELFLHRQHRMRSTRANPTLQSREGWFDPGRAGRLTFPSWRLFREYGAVVGRAALGPRTRLRCYVELLRWLRWHWRDLAFDLRYAARHLMGGRA